MISNFVTVSQSWFLKIVFFISKSITSKDGYIISVVFTHFKDIENSNTPARKDQTSNFPRYSPILHSTQSQTKFKTLDIQSIYVLNFFLFFKMCWKCFEAFFNHLNGDNKLLYQQQYYMHSFFSLSQKKKKLLLLLLLLMMVIFLYIFAGFKTSTNKHYTKFKHHIKTCATHMIIIQQTNQKKKLN